MKLFQHGNRERSARSREIYAAFELVYTVVDFAAAICFVIGSILFFNEATVVTGTWLFLVGSVFFAAKPTLRLIREIKLAAMGDAEDLADRFKG